MTQLQNNMMEAFLKSLKPGQQAVAQNGRVLNFEAPSSDGHSFVFTIEGISGRKVYSNHGIGSALPENFTIDLTASLGLTEKELAVETATTKAKTKKADGVPKLWIGTLLQTGALKMFGVLEVQGNDASAIYKGMSSRNLPIFSVKKVGGVSITSEFSFDGNLLGNYEKEIRLKVPANFFSLKTFDLFNGVKVGDSFYDLSGKQAIVESITANGSFTARVQGYARRYNCNGVSLNKNSSHCLVSNAEPAFVVPTAKRCFSTVEVSPGVFKSRHVQKVPALIKARVTKTVMPSLQSITSFLSGAKEKFLVISQEGIVLSHFNSEPDAQFETTMEANKAPGTKVQLVKVQVLGYSEVPKPVAVFKPV